MIVEALSEAIGQWRVDKESTDMKHRSLIKGVSVAVAIGACAAAVAAESCITSGWPVATEAVKSDVSSAVVLSVPLPAASAPLTTSLEARECVETFSEGTYFSSLPRGCILIVR